MSWFPPAQSGWPWTRTTKLVGGIFLAQLVLVFGLSRKAPAPALAEPRVQPVRWVWQEGRPQSPFEELPDAAALSLVTSGGFSGPLWARSVTIEPPTLASRFRPEQPERDSGSRSPGLSRAGASAAAEPPPAVISVLTPAPMKLPAGPLLEVFPSGVRLHAAGPGLTGIQPAPSPVWTNAEVLGPTRVGILVEPAGGVLSATLVPPGSGLAAADQDALKQARSMRFQPTRGPEETGALRWGEVEFLWRTERAPSDTTSVPRPP